MKNLATIVHANSNRLGKFAHTGFIEESMFYDLTINHLKKINKSPRKAAAFDYTLDFGKTNSLAEGITQVALNGYAQDETESKAEYLSFEDKLVAKNYLYFIKNKRLAKYAKNLTDLRALVFADILSEWYPLPFQTSIQQYAIQLAKKHYQVKRKQEAKQTVKQLKQYGSQIWDIQDLNSVKEIYQIQEEIKNIDITLSEKVEYLKHQIENLTVNKIKQFRKPLDKNLARIQNQIRNCYFLPQDMDTLKELQESYRKLCDEEYVNQCQFILEKSKIMPHKPETVIQLLVRMLNQSWDTPSI
ncbi:MAG: hypothetical protein ABIF40_00035 [archaeon]